MIWWALVAGIVIGLTPRAMHAWVRPDIRLRSADWGKVYILEDVRTPTLIKVGLTRRSAFVRGREVSRNMTGGRELRRVLVVHMPYATIVEAEAHRLLARRQQRSERGYEWFRVAKAEIGIAAVTRAARTVRRVARLRKRWSREADEDATITFGDSTHPMFTLCSPQRRTHGRDPERS